MNQNVKHQTTFTSEKEDLADFWAQTHKPTLSVYPVQSLWDWNSELILIRDAVSLGRVVGFPDSRGQSLKNERSNTGEQSHRSANLNGGIYNTQGKQVDWQGEGGGASLKYRWTGVSETPVENKNSKRGTGQY